MDAVRHKHSEVVAFLKRNGAVLHHDKAKGLLPMPWLAKCKHPRFLTLLDVNVIKLAQHNRSQLRVTLNDNQMTTGLPLL